MRARGPCGQVAGVWVTGGAIPGTSRVPSPPPAPCACGVGPGGPGGAVGLSPGQEKVLGAAGTGAADGGRAVHLYDVHGKLEATNRGSHCDSEN